MEKHLRSNNLEKSRSQMQWCYTHTVFTGRPPFSNDHKHYTPHPTNTNIMNIFTTTKFKFDGLEYETNWKDYVYTRSSFYAARAVRQLGPVPAHIAFCMDGNRRYAKKEQLELGNGHVAGFESMLRILVACYQLGIQTVSVYAFSIENFNRAPEESEALFDLVRTRLWDMVADKNSQISQLDWKIEFPGRRALLDRSVLDRITDIEEKTRHCCGMTVNICAPYTTRDDLATALQAAAQSREPASMAAFEQKRYLAAAPKLDILVRTSGETRLSDFMVWEADSQCTFEFIPQLWPEFTVWELLLIVIKWQLRNHRKNSGSSIMSLGAAPPRASVTKRQK